MKFIFVFMLSLISTNISSQTNIGLGYNLGYNFGAFAGVDNTINGCFVYKLFAVKVHVGAQQHGISSIKYKYGCTLGYNKIIKEKVMFNSLLGVRFVKIEKQDPYLVLNFNGGIVQESGIYYKVAKKRNVFLGINTYLIPIENYEYKAVRRPDLANPNVSLLLSIIYLKK